VYFSPRIEYADVPILATTGAVRIAEPVADVEQAYGSKFRATTVTNGGEGTWSLSTVGGQLSGVTQRIRTSSGARVIVIGSIYAGLPGCPILEFRAL